jgi:hypothetical protein
MPFLFKKWVSIFPAAVWNTFGVIGVLVVGLVFGVIIGASAVNDTAGSKVAEENKDLHSLILGYEKLKNLYDLQGENIAIMFDENILYNHPEEIREAFDSAGQYRDQILIQLGRIYELRRAADLPETHNERSN